MNNLVSVLLIILLTASCKNSSREKDNKSNDLANHEISSLKHLASPADSVSAEPYLFTDKNGLVYMSWIEKIKERSVLKFSTLNNEQWAEPLVISSGDNWFVNWADYPVVAADGKNNLIAHFLEKSDTSKFTYDVKLVSSADNGKSWSNPKILHDDGKEAEHGFVSIIPYNDQYFISWLDGRKTAMEEGAIQHKGHHGEMTLRAAMMDKMGNKIKEWELDGRVCDCCQTSATVTGSGPVVIYRDRSDDETRDISIVRYVDGQWTSPATIYPDQWKIAGCPVNGPRADAMENSLAIAWFTMADKNGRVNIVFSEDGGATFGNPIRIDEDKAIGRVDVAMLDKETAMVSWMEGPVIKAAKVYNDCTKELSITIASSSSARSSGFPQMTKAGGRILFAWADDKEKTIKAASISVGD